jgi:phosphoglycolate phosphatase/putative hydrolase of the HAD superfamily
VVTNNPRSVGEDSIRALGVEKFFRFVVGLDDTDGVQTLSQPFKRALKLLGAPADSCVSIGDRYDVDIAVPLDLGMGAVLVDGVEDVYVLPGLLAGRTEASGSPRGRPRRKKAGKKNFRRASPCRR